MSDLGIFSMGRGSSSSLPYCIVYLMFFSLSPAFSVSRWISGATEVVQLAAQAAALARPRLLHDHLRALWQLTWAEWRHVHQETLAATQWVQSLCYYLTANIYKLTTYVHVNASFLYVLTPSGKKHEFVIGKNYRMSTVTSYIIIAYNVQIF